MICNEMKCMYVCMYLSVCLCVCLRARSVCVCLYREEKNMVTC